MKARSIMIVAAAMLVGVGGGAMAGRNRQSAAMPTQIKSAPRDSAENLVTPDPTRSVAAVPTDSASRGAATRSAAVTTDSTPAAGDSARTSVTATQSGPASDSLAEGQARASRLFSTMPASDAARVLAQMTDEEALAILRPMRERQAAGIVAQLDAKRAAAIGRALLNERIR